MVCMTYDRRCRKISDIIIFGYWSYSYGGPSTYLRFKS
jgi:hypothetical protein